MQVSAEVLKSTGIASEVKRQRSSIDSRVRAAASALISRWRDQIKGGQKKEEGKQPGGLGKACQDERPRKRLADDKGETARRRPDVSETSGVHTQSGVKEMPKSGGIDNRSAPVLLDDSGGQASSSCFGTRRPPATSVCLSWPAQGVGRSGGESRQDELKEDKGKGAYAQTDKNREKPCRRERARQALLTALLDGLSSSAQERHHQICRDVESHVWDLSAHDTEAYINKIQTLKFNLSKNSSLCQELMAGIVAASQVLGTVFSSDKVTQTRLSRWQASGRPRRS